MKSQLCFHWTYKDFLIKPSRRVKEKLIIKEWPDNIRRILVSLGLKTTSQSIIIGKLSSYERRNRTKRAMWEFDSIFRSIYILRYIDDILLRQHVFRAINRGEAYHQLRRSVSHVNSGKFRVKTELEQQIWSECARLIANSIIFFNAHILSRFLARMEGSSRSDVVRVIKRISPVAWRHVNLDGRFQFNTKRIYPDIDAILSNLEPVIESLQSKEN